MGARSSSSRLVVPASRCSCGSVFGGPFGYSELVVPARRPGSELGHRTRCDNKQTKPGRHNGSARAPSDTFQISHCTRERSGDLLPNDRRQWCCRARSCGGKLCGTTVEHRWRGRPARVAEILAWKIGHAVQFATRRGAAHMSRSAELPFDQEARSLVPRHVGDHIFSYVHRWSLCC